MKKTKNKLKNILFLFATLFFISCSNEENFISGHHHDEKKNDISLQQFLNETNMNSFDTKLNIGKKDNQLYRNAQLSDFIIDTTSILKHIAENNKTTYSFEVNSVSAEFSNDKTYNLVYFKENDLWKKAVVSFNETETSDKKHSFSNFENLYSDSSTLRSCFTYVEVDVCKGELCSGPCDGCNYCIQRVAILTPCYGGAGGGQIPDIDIPNTHGNGGGGDANLEFEPNPKGGGGDLIDNPNPTPCDNLKAKAQNTAFNAKVTELNNDAANSFVETGYVTYSDSPSYPTKEYGEMDNDGGSFIVLNVNPNRTGQVTGFIHCHQNNPIFKNLAVFSPEDLIGFGSIIQNSTVEVTEFMCLVTSSKGTFAIKITDKQAYINFAVYLATYKKAVNDYYEKKIKHTYSVDRQIKELLNLIQNNSNGGIELYEKLPDNTWQKKYLDSENNVQQIKC